MKNCATCSMPLGNETLIGYNNGKDIFCIYCIDENKKVKSCAEIFQGGVDYFVNEEKFTKEYAEKVVRKNMTQLSFWKSSTSPCLQGDMLTDEEFNKLFIKK